MNTEGGLLSDDDDADVEQQIEQYVASLGDTPRIRQALRTILTASQLDDGQLETLPEEVRLAYDALFADAFPNDLGALTSARRPAPIMVSGIPTQSIRRPGRRQPTSPRVGQGCLAMGCSAR